MIRTLTLNDLSALLALQAQVYPAHLNESEKVMHNRLQHFASTCWGAFEGDTLQGYLLAYPSNLGYISPLGADFSNAAEPNTLYLHDMAISQASQGRGLARELLAKASGFSTQAAFSQMALVAVQGAEGYWSKQGFSALLALSAEQQSALQSYAPEQALYMVKAL